MIKTKEQSKQLTTKPEKAPLVNKNHQRATENTKGQQKENKMKHFPMLFQWEKGRKKAEKGTERHGMAKKGTERQRREEMDR